jgi:hypothetical protein
VGLPGQSRLLGQGRQTGLSGPGIQGDQRINPAGGRTISEFFH